MDDRIYYGSTFILFAICVCGGIALEDLGVAFEFITAISLSFLSFIWPGMFYIRAENRYGHIYSRDSKRDRNISRFMIVVGSIVFISIVSANFLDLFD